MSSNKAIYFLLLIAGLLLLAGCGQKNHGSCTYPEGCTDYNGAMWLSPLPENTCSQVPNGTFSTSPCPMANLVGSCAHSQGTASEYILRFYSPRFTAQMAHAGCTGNWIP